MITILTIATKGVITVPFTAATTTTTTTTTTREAFTIVEFTTTVTITTVMVFTITLLSVTTELAVGIKGCRDCFARYLYKVDFS